MRSNDRTEEEPISFTRLGDIARDILQKARPASLADETSEGSIVRQIAVAERREHEQDEREKPDRSHQPTPKNARAGEGSGKSREETPKEGIIRGDGSLTPRISEKAPDFPSRTSGSAVVNSELAGDAPVSPPKLEIDCVTSEPQREHSPASTR
ncbi:MAG: hypothetical protein JO107_00095 [Hyphomicrobiales bacterium]|nr:hypothetical protein [Hyphomicrobiales bacterium]